MMSFASVSTLAHAHGEEVLVSVFAQFVSLVICAMLIWKWRRAAGHRIIAVVACVAGVVVGDWAVSGLAYTQYQNLITVVGLIVPLGATVGAIYVSHRFATWKRQSC